MKKVYLLMTLAVVITACGQSQQQNAKHKTKSFMQNVKTVSATEEKKIKELTFTGRVISNPDLTVNYSSLVNGVIDRTYFSLGDYVTKGQVMLDMRSTELSTLESELIKLATSLQVAEREFKSAKDMFADNMLSEREYLESMGKVKQITADYDKIKADMEMYGKSKGTGIFSVVAPVSGYVISKAVVAGETASNQGEPLFAIADLSEVWVIANVYAGNLQFVTQGMEAQISSVAYPNEIFKGKVNTVSQVFDTDDKTLKARITLPNTGIKLKPEMSVVVKLKNQSTTSTMALPDETIIFDNNAYFVVLYKNNAFTIRQVSISGQHAGKTYIASGIEQGEQIVAKNQLLIYNDLKSN